LKLSPVTKSLSSPTAIPAVVFTDPEVAWCGLTESQAQNENREVKVAKFPWAASGRAVTLDRPEGMTKLLIDPQTERVLGVGIVGVGAGELIAEGVLAIEMAALAKDVAHTIHPHPTLSETLMEVRRSFLRHQHRHLSSEAGIALARTSCSFRAASFRYN
jgi:dihydrolipoamide dehydrogenase